MHKQEAQSWDESQNTNKARESVTGTRQKKKNKEIEQKMKQKILPHFKE